MYPTSLEQEVKRFLHKKKVDFQDNSASYTLLDFVILFKGEPYFHLEVKEKQRRYNTKNWPPFAEEADLFILDDLTVRKCLAHAPRSGVLVRDNVRGAYFFFSVIDLALMPRQRVNRDIRRKASAVKGKWLVNLRNGARAGNMEEAFAAVRAYVEALDDYLFTTTECYGDYVDEEVVSAGIVRKSSYWDRDVQSTR
jgi:hypothetical protein